jgi:Methylamine utilisation protein MauE
MFDAFDQGAQAQVAHALQLAVGSVFLAAAVVKLRHPRRFANVVADYQLGTTTIAGVAAITVILTEFFVAGSLLMAVHIYTGVVVAMAALAAFAVAVAANLRRGRRISCGCFGDNEELSSSTLMRIGLLFVAIMVILTLRLFDTQLLNPTWILENGISGVAYALQTGLVASSVVMIAVWALNTPKILSMIGGTNSEGAQSTSQVDVSALEVTK